MECNNKGLVALGIAAVVAVSALAALPLSGRSPDVSVTVSPGGASSVSSPASGQGGTFGSAPGDTSNWIAGDFSGDLAVHGSLSASGTVYGPGLPKMAAVTMASGTTTACTIAAPASGNRVYVAAGVVDTGTAASTGAVTWRSGTTTYSGVSPTAGLLNTYTTRAAGIDAITTTSAAMTAYMQQRASDVVSFVSGTTTNSGTCWAIYYGN